MAKKQRYYVVWQGVQPGIYTTWEHCRKQIDGFKGARYKAFDSLAQAEAAFKLPPPPIQRQSKVGELEPMTADNFERYSGPGGPELNSIAVDAACSGNPGVMEYQGVYVGSNTRLFHFKAPKGTNNIGEFLAIVHGLAYIKNHRLEVPLYSDSVNAINWVRAKQCRTKLRHDQDTAQLFDVIRRAESWLHNNQYATRILKWETERWGEIPADFGRK